MQCSPISSAMETVVKSDGQTYQWNRTIDVIHMSTIFYVATIWLRVVWGTSRFSLLIVCVNGIVVGIFVTQSIRQTCRVIDFAHQAEHLLPYLLFSGTPKLITAVERNSAWSSGVVILIPFFVVTPLLITGVVWSTIINMIIT